MDRNLDFGAAFSRVFDLYGSHAAPLLTWAAVVNGITALLGAFTVTAVLSGSVSGAALGFSVLFAFAIVASAVLTGAYLVGIDEAERTGSFPSFSSVWERVTPRLVALILTGLLAGLGIGLGLVFLVVPGLILYTWWAVIGPVVMLEDTEYAAALGRSRALVQGNGWTVFGLIMVIGFLTAIVSGVIGGIIDGIFSGFVGEFLSQFVSGTIVAPVSALLGIVIYQSLAGGGPGSGDDAQLPPAAPPTTPPADPGSSPQGPFV